MTINITKNQFPLAELITINENDLKTAHYQLGLQVSSQAKDKLNQVLGQNDKLAQTSSLLNHAGEMLAQLEKLANDQVFTIQGTNWLARYLEAFTGYCQGTGLEPAQCALLQAEILTECQTILIQDQDTQEIRFVHTEEDGDYSTDDLQQNPFRLVEMTIQDQNYTFFAYPGLCSWGPAFGVNHRHGLVQMVDDLYVNEGANQGPLWANAIAFMAMDCADQNIIKTLLERASQALGGFWGGYALHFIWTNSQPTMSAVEFAHNQVSWEEPVKLADRSFFVHANCPIQAEIQPWCETGVPIPNQSWPVLQSEMFTEMRLRHQHLQAKAAGINWLKQTLDQSIETGLKLLASPEGDIGGYSDKNDNENWEYITALPSKWTLAHLVGFVSATQTQLTIGRFVPAPIPGYEYSLTPKKGFPFAQQKIWQVTKRFQQAVTSGIQLQPANWQPQLILPPKLHVGDEIRVIAPALSLSTVDQDICQKAEKRLNDLGLNVTYGRHTLQKDVFGSSAIESRLKDLHEAFADPRVKAIISADGGYNSNQLLQYIDWELIKSSPKILTGYSDITALQNAILAKTGLVTYSGALFWSIGIEDSFEYSKKYIQKCLFENKTYEIKSNPVWEDDNGEVGEFSKPWQDVGFLSVGSGEAFGRIVGGNLSTFGLLRGTPYFPDLENTVLFLEDDYEYQLPHFDRDLEALIQQPGFVGVRGLVWGRFEAQSELTPELFQAMIKSKKALNGIPIIANVDFGHTYPKAIIPIGGLTHIKSSPENSTIQILQH